jgi:hypothetical protein
VRLIGVSQFESPDVIPQFGPMEDLSVGQISEVAKHRRLVEPQRRQFIGEFGMSDGSLGMPELTQDQNPRWRAAQARRAQQRANLHHFRIFVTSSGHRIATSPTSEQFID